MVHLLYIWMDLANFNLSWKVLIFHLVEKPNLSCFFFYFGFSQDPDASYDVNDGDPDPQPRYTQLNDNR